MVPQRKLFDFFAYGARKEIEEISLPMKRKTPEAVDLTLSLGISLLPRAGTEVSTKLSLSDETWPSEDRKQYVKELSEADMKERAVARKIAEMENYRHGEKEEEKQKGISTKLELYLAPWIIKKRLIRSDLDHLCRLTLPRSSVENHVLPLMGVDMVNKIADDGLLVKVCDQDTDSMHQLTFKQYPSSRCYVFNGNWSRDFVKRRNLKVGDELGMYWDPNSSRLNFCVLDRAPTIQPAASAANGTSTSGRN